jgi:hypothetical integral membrane protein (TIGR02206 family)
MNSFSIVLSDQQLYSIHNSLTCILFIFWIVICFLGYTIKNCKYRKNITISLICISAFQELFDYYNRFFLNELYNVNIQTDLPLQLCHIAYWFSVICLISKLYYKTNNQFYFNCAYFFGFSGALQGIITVDLSGIYTFYDMLTLHLQHSLIILNLLWLIFAYNMKFNKRGIIQSFLFINVLVIIIGAINLILDSNYMFLCAPPNVNNLFLIGQWPYYLIILEVIFLVYGYVLYLPFVVIKYLNRYK